VILGVNNADDKEIAAAFLKEIHITYPNLLDNSVEAISAMEHYETLKGMTAVPFSYVIDRTGKVVDAWYGFEPGRAEKALKKAGL
jgi:peroxiredoxin